MTRIIWRPHALPSRLSRLVHDTRKAIQRAVQAVADAAGAVPASRGQGPSTEVAASVTLNRLRVFRCGHTHIIGGRWA